MLGGTDVEVLGNYTGRSNTSDYTELEISKDIRPARSCFPSLLYLTLLDIRDRSVNGSCSHAT